MSAIKEIAEEESARRSSGIRNEIHLYREGSFLRAYQWSAWLSCRLLHDFKVNKRKFKDVGTEVAYIGFPEKSLEKWLPEGVEQKALGEKHLQLTLPMMMLGDDVESLEKEYGEWLSLLPLTESKERQHRDDSAAAPSGGSVTTLTGIMQQILAWPVESKSPMESMTFLADVKQRLAALV